MHSSAHHIVEPYDHPVSHRHLHITYSSIKYSDKTFMGMTTSPKNAEDVHGDVRHPLWRRLSWKIMRSSTGNCNGNSPLVWDETMLGAMRAFSKPQPAGAVLPLRAWGREHARLGGAGRCAAERGSAERTRLYTGDPQGCPAIYGHYLSTVSMKSGAPMAGTPEISLMNFLIGQLARYYNVPWRTSGSLGGAKTFDAQAGYESAATLNAVIHAGANYIWHAAGWNEAGMHCSVAKFIVDAEQCAMAYRMAEGPRWDDFDEALSAVRDVGPGGHYLGHPHTQENFQRAFFMPDMFDNNSIEQWKAEGEVEIIERALTQARKLLLEYQEPKLDEAKNEALLDYIARREREIPAEDALNQDY
jgi:trimethylamine--corrinoid protein Co-methyltransferase